MSKQYKKQKTAVIPLAKGYGLIVPEHSDSLEIMVAIWSLVQILALADGEQGVDYNKFKEMVNGYIDNVYSEVLKKK